MTMQTKIHNITKNVAPITSRAAMWKFTLKARIFRYITDAAGTIISNPALVPATMQKPFPFHLFGAFDREGGYNIADIVTREYNTILYSVFVWGLGTQVFPFNPFADVNTKFQKGDIVFVYVDDINNPNNFAFVIVRAQQGGFASLVSQSNISQIDDNGQWGVMQFTDFSINWSNDTQLNYPFYLIQTRFDGGYRYDPINPEAYRYTEQKPGVKKVTIPLGMVLNQYSGLSSYISFENDLLEILFNLYL